MRRALWFIGVPLAAFVGGVTGSVPVYVMGLVVPVFLVGPLALLTGSLLATLLAGWVANLAGLGSSGGASVRTRSRLLPIFGVSLLAAVGAVLLYWVAACLVNAFGLGPNLATDLAVYLPGAAIFLGATAAATRRLRAPAEGGLGLGGIAALALSAVWVMFLSIFLGLGPLLGLGPTGLGIGASAVAVFGGGFALAALGASLAVRRSRWGPRRRALGWDAALTLGLIGLVPAVVMGTVALGCSVSYCGA